MSNPGAILHDGFKLVSSCRQLAAAAVRLSAVAFLMAQLGASPPLAVAAAISAPAGDDSARLAAGADASTPRPSYVWHTFYGGSVAYGMDQPMDMALDAAGNAYIVGISDAAWNGPGSTPPRYPFQAGFDIVILKLDRDGNYQWHAFFGSAAPDFGNGIALDPAGNVYVAGWSEGAWDGPGATPPLHAFSGTVARELMVLKLSSSGTYQWHTFFGSATANDTGAGIALDRGTSLVYVGGSSRASWNGPSGEAPLHAYAGGADTLVMKLTTDGTYQWHTFLGSAGYDDYAAVLTLDGSGSLFALGYSKGPWDGPGLAAPLHAYTGAKDLLLMKLDFNGSYKWHTFYGGATDDEYGGLGLDSVGNLYASGGSRESWNGPGDTLPLNGFTAGIDILALKLDSKGAYQWHTFYGSTADDWPWGLSSPGETSDLYLVSDSGASWNGPGDTPPWNPHSGGGSSDIVTLDLGTDGSYKWHAFFGAPAVYDGGEPVVVDGEGGVYVAGNSWGTWNGPDGVPPLNPYAGGSDIAVIKMSTFQVGWPLPDNGSEVCSLSPVGINLGVTDLMRTWTGGFDRYSVALRLDDVDVTAQTTVFETESSPVVRASLVYQPIVALSEGLHTASLTYPKSSSPGVLSMATLSWTFTVVPCALSPSAPVHPYNPKAPNLPISH